MKKTIYLFVVFLTFFACEKEESDISLRQNDETQFMVNGNGNGNNSVDLCHYSDDDDTWHVISVNQNAVNAHLNHGDVILIDADGDGWVEAENECVPGGDCNDNDASINPGAEEVCEDEIDNNCNGEVDEECIACQDCSFSNILNAIDLTNACWDQIGAFTVIYTLGANGGSQCCGIAIDASGFWLTGFDFDLVSGESSADCFDCFNQFIQDNEIPSCNSSFRSSNSNTTNGEIFSKDDID